MATEKWKTENTDKMKSYRKTWYHRNAETERAKAIVRTAARRVEMKKWYDELKSKLSCSECGYNKHFAALDFHHLDESTKEFTIGNSIKRFSKERILKEISKCIVLCANCHRIHHFVSDNE